MDKVKVLNNKILKIGETEELESCKLILESAQDAIFIKDLESRYIFVNRKTLEAFGNLPREKVLGKNDYELLPPDQAKVNVGDDQKVFKTGKPVEISKKMTMGDKEFYFQAVKTPIKDDKGKVIGLIGIARDIIERKRAEEALQASEEKYRSLVANIPDVTWTTDNKGNTTFVSPNVEEVYRYSPEEIYKEGNRLWFGRIHSDDVENVKKAYKKLFEEKIRFDIEYRIKRRDGEWIWLHDRAITTYEKDGVMYADGIFSDITQRRQAEEQIKSYQKKIETLIDSSSDLIFLKDKDFRYLIANKVHEKLFNMKIKDIIGKTDFDFMPKKIAEECRKSDEKALISEGPIEKEEFVDDNCFQVVKQKVVDATGNIIGIAAVIRDITQRKKAEEALQQQKLFLEQKNLALKEIIEHIEETKNKTKEDITINVNEILLPILKKLKLRKASPKYVDLLQYHLEELTSSFGRKITEKSIKLTPREIEICNIVRGGLTSKEIAELLNISQQTVEKHRKNIRHKIGISNKSINLTSFLHKL